MISIRPDLIFLAIILIISAINPQICRAANSATTSSAGSTAGVNPHAISLYNLGLSAYKQGSPESAIIFFKRAVDLDPDLADAQYNLGVLYQSERRLKEAVPRFEEALRVKPDDTDSHYQLALALIDLSQLPQARQHLMAIAPNSGHFSDAQKKLAFIDSQANNQTNISASTFAAMTDSVSTAASTGSTSSTALTGLDSSTAGSSTASSVDNSNSNKSSQVSASVAASLPTPETTSNPVALLSNTSIQTVASGFAAPSGLAFDHQGNLYIANFLNSTIDRIAPNGTKSQFSSGINLKGPIGLIVDNDDSLYVANYLSGTVTRINAAGIAQIIASGLKKPYYLAIDKEGNLFVSQQENNSVIRINFAHDK